MMWAGCVSWWNVNVADCYVLVLVKVYDEGLYFCVDGVNVCWCL